MTATLYHYPKCSTCKKAIKWLAANDVPVKLIDIVEAPPSKSKLKKIHAASGLPIKRLFNTSGVSYRAGGFSAKLPEMSDAECYEALADDGKLIKRPILDSKDATLIGFNEANYENGLG